MAFLTDEEIDKRIAQESNRSGGLANVNQQSSRPAWMPPIEQYEPSAPERTLGGTAKDVLVSLGKGVVGTGQAAIGLADIVTPGQLGKAIEDTGIDLGAAQEYLSEQYTPAQQAAFERVEQAKGFLPTLGTMVQNPSTIVHSVIESLPAVAGGGLVGRGLLAAAPRIGGLAAGAIGEAAVTAGQTAESIREQSPERTITGKQAAMALGAGAGTGALGLVGGAIARKFGVGDIDTMLASKQFAEKSNKGVVRRILEGGISEGAFEELPQSMQEQVWMNAATGKDLTEGIGEAGAAGLLAGTAMGGGANVFTSSAVRESAEIKDQTDWNQYFQDYELQELNNEYQNIQAAKQASTTPEEQAIIKQRQNQVINKLNERKESVDAQNGIIKTPEEIQRDRDQRQFEYEQLFGLPVGVKSAQESAEAILEQKPLSDIEQAQRDRQRQIEETYLPAEIEADRINQYRLAEAEQAGESEPVPLRASDMITRDGKPYQRREYLEGYLEALPNGNDYEIVEVPNGFIGRLTDEALDPRRNQMVWEDETGRYPSEANYWNVQREAIRRQQETPLQTATERRVPFEEILPRTQQEAIDATEYDIERPVPIGEEITQPEMTPAVTEVEQTVKRIGAEETVVPEEAAPIVEEDSLIKDYNNLNTEITQLQNQLETIQDEQAYTEDNYTQNQLQRQAEKITAQIDLKQDQLNKVINEERLISKIQGEDSRFEVRSEQEPGQGISLPDIQKMYKGQEVFQGDDGTISIRLKNGKGITVQNIQDAGKGFIQYAIDTGQMSKKGKILGVTTGTNILLDSEFADNSTLWHENKHVLDNLGMITEKDNALLNKEFNKLRKANRLNFTLSTHEDPRLAMEENRANMFAQIMLERENYRNTPLGKVIQKIMDFFNKLYGMGQRFVGRDFQTLSEFANEIESGKFYERPSVELDVPTEAPQFRGAGNINSEEFKNWFDKSVAKTKDGEPVPFYHGSPNAFTVFEDRPAAATQKTAAGLGHFFTMDKDYAAGYAKGSGNVIEAYLKMEKPYKMTLDESDKFITVQQAIDRKNDLKAQGYDSIILQIPGAHPIITVFDSNQVKSTANRGTWNTSNPDIRFEVREQNYSDLTKPEQKISDDVYRDIYEQQSSLVEKLNQNIKKTGREINRGMNKYLGMISTNLKKINPILEAKVRKLGFDTTQAIKNDLETAKPLLDKLKDMSPQDKSDWHWASVNGDSGRINQITEKYGITETYRNVRESLNRIRRDAEKVGYNIGFIDEYWPRILKDRTGFLQATKGLANEAVFSDALKAQADKLGTTVDQLDDGLKADIISNIILGRPSGIGGPVNIRQRYFAEVPPEYAKFYMDSDAALMSYVYSMNKKIEARKFFGKVPERIAGIKKDKRTKETRLANLKELENNLVADGQDITAVKEQIDSIKGDIQIAQNELDKYGSQDDFKENIGSYVMDLMIQEKINPGTGVKANDEQALKDILTARFNEKGTTGLANVYKNLSYIDTMGSPISAITQLGDLAWAVYVGGLTPRGIANSVKNIGKALIGKSNITREDIGITRIAQEFADGDTLSNAVSKVFKIVGIEKLDKIGKEALINNSFDNYRRKAEMAAKDSKEMERFKNELKPIFGNKSEKVINDLLDPNVAMQSEDIKLLVYSRLLDFQPADLSETPEAYLSAGNGRLFYMLKMFTLKQFDVFRREVWHNIKTGERDKVIEGLGNATRLMAILSLANAGSDELKDWLLGKDTKFEDHVIENLLTLGGASRYLRMQTTKEGIGSGLAGQILPPFKFIDAISKDVLNDTRDGLRSIDSIPVVGKLYYWHLGRGKDNRLSIEEQDFKKETKEIRKFKKDFNDAKDKRLFLQSNFDMFKQMKFYDNMTKAIKGNKTTIDKLKKIDQTPNVRKRLSQLEQQRKDLINRYFEMKNNL